jgi:hypothetical protein
MLLQNGRWLARTLDVTGSDYKLFVVTFLATLLSTLPGVFLGVALERRRARNKQREYYHLSGAWERSYESVLFDVRDWCGDLYHVMRGTGGPFAVNRKLPGLETLKFVISEGVMPKDKLIQALYLLEYLSIVHDAMPRAFTQPIDELPDEFYNYFVTSCWRAYEAANHLVHYDDGATPRFALPTDALR